jgi:hypothetical protein
MSSSFDQFQVRPVSEADRPYLTEIISQDPYHRWNMTADFFLKRPKGEDAWAVEDQQGNIVLYFKTQTAVRFSCIFARSETRRDKATNARVLRAGWQWICRLLSRNGYRELITDTESPDLAMFTKKVLGFSSLKEQLSKAIPLTATGETEKNSLHTYEEFSRREDSGNVRIQ